MIGHPSEISLTEKMVRSAKQHGCDLCPMIIPVGVKVHYVSGCILGRFYSGWQHPLCWAAFLSGRDMEAPVALHLLRTAQDVLPPSLRPRKDK